TIAPASPNAITSRHFLATSSGASRVYGSPLCRPPSSSTTGRSIASTATTVEAMLVALESLIHSTPPTSRTGSSRCGSARNERGRIVAVQHPHVASPRVAEQQLLVVVVGIHRRVAVQVVRGEVREDPDVRREVGAVVQLKRRHLHCQPLVPVTRHGDVRERPADVPGRFGLKPRFA